MGLPKETENLHLHLLPTRFQLAQFGPDDAIPAEVLGLMSKPGPGFLSVTRTGEEVSVVSDMISPDLFPVSEEGGSWRCIRVQGPMAFSECALL